MYPWPISQDYSASFVLQFNSGLHSFRSRYARKDFSNQLTLNTPNDKILLPKNKCFSHSQGATGLSQQLTGRFWSSLVTMMWCERVSCDVTVCLQILQKKVSLSNRFGSERWLTRWSLRYVFAVNSLWQMLHANSVTVAPDLSVRSISSVWWLYLGKTDKKGTWSWSTTIFTS